MPAFLLPKLFLLEDIIEGARHYRAPFYVMLILYLLLLCVQQQNRELCQRAHRIL